MRLFAIVIVISVGIAQWLRWDAPANRMTRQVMKPEVKRALLDWVAENVNDSLRNSGQLREKYPTIWVVKRPFDWTLLGLKNGGGIILLHTELNSDRWVMIEFAGPYRCSVEVNLIDNKLFVPGDRHYVYVDGRISVYDGDY